MNHNHVICEFRKCSNLVTCEQKKRCNELVQQQQLQELQKSKSRAVIRQMFEKKIIINFILKFSTPLPSSFSV